MIHNRKPLSMAESNEYTKNVNLKSFIKSFSSLTPEKAKELRKKLENLNIIKINERQISKIIDLLPENKEDLNKIIHEVNLDENETNTILQTIKNAI
ncbi:MAG: hypothetical protein WC812_03990 [Candidatus Pacearchaeota archaeon]|jgi:DNA-directed RNA polymerase subunit F